MFDGFVNLKRRDEEKINSPCQGLALCAKDEERKTEKKNGGVCVLGGGGGGDTGRIMKCRKNGRAREEEWDNRKRIHVIPFDKAWPSRLNWSLRSSGKGSKLFHT